MYELKQKLDTVNGTICYCKKPKTLQIHIWQTPPNLKCFLDTFRTIWGEKKSLKQYNKYLLY